MNLITIDFETAYDNKYSLRHMTTTEYLLDPLFQIIGVGVKLNNEAAEWNSLEQLGMKAWMAKYPWSDATVIAHNAMFDGAILEWKLGIRPKQYFCTMMGARPYVSPFIDGKMNLRDVSQQLGVGEKGHEVENTKGMWRTDFDGAAMLRFAVYCLNDVDLSYRIARKLLPLYPTSEVRLVDLTIKKFTRPRLNLDKDILTTALQEEQHSKLMALRKAEVNDAGLLQSNPAFAELLEDRGVTPPTKTSIATGRKTFAFAKTDHEFMFLLEHPNSRVRNLVEARLKIKSTIEETRLTRFLNIREHTRFLPVPLLYYGAHTGRLSGLDKMNMQNLTRGSALRRALIAPPGYKIVTGDLSQIEARILAVLAGQEDLVGQFAAGEDVYCSFASRLFQRPITKADKRERFIGKTCILGLGYGLGWEKFYDTMRVQKTGSINRAEARSYVNKYRTTYSCIPQYWRRMDGAINNMATGGGMSLGPVTFDWYKLMLPNGMPIFYPNLKQSSDGFMYTGGRKVKSLWGGSLTENVVQALARIIISDAEITLSKHGIHAVLQVHDELVYVVKEAQVDAVSRALEKVLTKRVSWIPTLPLACEVKFGNSYAEAK